MGAFFLYRKSSPINVEEGRSVFKAKGFVSPEEFSLGGWALLLYRKMLIEQGNHVSDNVGMSLYACGTVVYRKLDYKDSLTRLLCDFRYGQIDQSELAGNYCLLFWDGEILSILTDRFNVQRVFANTSYTCFSSSFLGVLASSPRPLPLNRLAVCEKLSTGYIISPDTLVEGIVQVNDQVAECVDGDSEQIVFIKHDQDEPISLHSCCFDESVARQSEILKGHFAQLAMVSDEFSGLLGISGGFDSRLILACSRYLSKPLSLYTHATQGVHELEIKITRRLAEVYGTELRTTPTRRMETLGPDEVGNVINDTLYYFDGRSSVQRGAFHETYTSTYQKKILSNNHFCFNGVGGEIYRNHTATGNRKIVLRDWLGLNMFFPFAQEAISDDEMYEAMQVHVIEKICHRLGEVPAERVDQLWRRRYYSEVRVPDSDGNIINAHNQVAFYHAPFMDPAVVREGVRGSSRIGSAGCYEAALIAKIAPELAAVRSHYGYALDNIPMTIRARSWMKCQMPEALQLNRLRLALRRLAPGEVVEFRQFAARVPVLGEVRDILCNSVLRKGFEAAMIHYAQRPTTLFVGTFLREFQHKIRW